MASQGKLHFICKVNGKKEPALGKSGEEHSRKKKAKCKGCQAGTRVCKDHSLVRR